MPSGGYVTSGGDGGGGDLSYGASIVTLGNSNSETGNNRLVRTVFWVAVNLLTWICVIGTIIGAVLSRRPNTAAIRSGFYSPGDSRVLSLSSFFCDGGSLELSSTSLFAMLFIVNIIPPLGNTNNFLITVDSSFNPSEFRFWQYHLHPNSNISLSVHTDFLVNVYIIKGNDNANRWRIVQNGEYAVETLERVTSILDSSYQVEVEEEYYVFIHNSLASRSVYVSASLSFERFEYSVPSMIGPDQSCVVRKEGHCHLNIPYKVGSQSFLVTTSISANVDFGENVRVSLRCDQREWTYVVLILVPVGIVTVIFVLLIFYCRRCGRCGRCGRK